MTESSDDFRQTLHTTAKSFVHNTFSLPVNTPSNLPTLLFLSTMSEPSPNYIILLVDILYIEQQSVQVKLFLPSFIPSFIPLPTYLYVEGRIYGDAGGEVWM